MGRTLNIFFPKNENPKTVKKAARTKPLIFSLKLLTRIKLKINKLNAFKNVAPNPPITRKSVIRVEGDVTIFFNPIMIFVLSIKTK